MNKTAKEILEKLEERGYEAYIVGGYVRDFLLGKATNDIDICTNAFTKEILDMFSGTINQYGILNLKINGLNIDITTFREEHNYQNRKPTSITYGVDLKTDLLRRDFTINTLCMKCNGEIIDKLNALLDLKSKKICVNGNPKIKIIEDPLRILRAIRFATLLNFTIEKKLEKAIIQNRSLVKTLSNYRIKEEVSKILLSPNYKKGLKLLKQYGLCNELGIFYTNIIYTNDLCGMWSQIKWKRNLPFTKSEKENIVKLHKILSAKMINREILFEYGLYLSLIVAEILGISTVSIHEIYASLPIYLRKDLQITFLEICETLQVEPSKKVKEIEDYLIKIVLNGQLDNTKEILINYLLEHKTRWYA